MPDLLDHKDEKKNGIVKKFHYRTFRKKEDEPTMAEVRDYSNSSWSMCDLDAYKEKRKLVVAFERILANRKELLNFATFVLITIITLLVLSTSSNAAGKSSTMLQKLELSYIAIFFVASLAWGCLRTFEFLLSKAGLIKPEVDAKVDNIHEWIFSEADRDDAKGAKLRIIDLWRWHKPIETEGGTRFPWKNDPKVHKSLDDIIYLSNKLLEQNKTLTHELEDLRREFYLIQRSMIMMPGRTGEAIPIIKDDEK